MNRRTYLRTLGAGAVAGATAGLAGCSSLTDANSDVVLPEPDREFDSADVPYPAWGERVPDVSVPAPLDGGRVALREVGRPYLATFFFSHCMSVCPALVGALRNVQAHAIGEGYANEVRFLPITFDPARDTADRLRAYADRMNVDLDAGWSFLRPADAAAAARVANDEFSIGFQKIPAEEVEMEDHEGYDFQHLSLVTLVNADGYVERAYTGDVPPDATLIEDLREVRGA